MAGAGYRFGSCPDPCRQSKVDLINENRLHSSSSNGDLPTRRSSREQRRFHVRRLPYRACSCGLARSLQRLPRRNSPRAAGDRAFLPGRQDKRPQGDCPMARRPCAGPRPWGNRSGRSPHPDSSRARPILHYDTDRQRSAHLAFSATSDPIGYHVESAHGCRPGTPAAPGRVTERKRRCTIKPVP